MDKFELEVTVKTRKLDSITGAYMCPCCFKIYRIDRPQIELPETINLVCPAEEYDKMVDHFTHVKPTVYTELRMMPLCCRAVQNMIPIDDEIADVVSMMNRKGFYTEFSCQGHRCTTLSDSTNFASIVVAHDIYTKLIPHILSWNVSHPERTFVIEQLAKNRHPRKSNYCLYSAIKSPKTGGVENTFDQDEFTDDEYNKLHAEVLKAFRTFVDTLPTMTGRII